MILPYLFLLAVFLIKAPSFYYLPNTASVLFTSHTFAKEVILLVFILTLISKYKDFIKTLVKSKLVLFLVFMYLLCQSLSFLNVSDTTLFLKSYHNILIGIIIFVLALFFSRVLFRKSIIYNYLTLTVSALLFLEVFFFLFPDLFLSLTKNFIQWELLSAYLVNLERRRFTLDLNLEMFAPILLSMLYIQGKKGKHIKTRLIFIIFVALVFMTFMSNFRSKAVALIFSLFLFFVVFLRQNLKNIFVSAVAVFAIAGLALVTSRSLFGFNMVDRFLLRRYEDMRPVKNRIKAMNHSIELFRLHPLTGVGLGNYVLYNNSPPIYSYFTMKSYQKTYWGLVAYSPHNIFFQTLSETGLLGIASLVLLLGFFMVRDSRYFRHSRITLVTGLVIGSWTIIIYCLFNPSYSLFVFGWFWFLRGLIEGVYENIASA